MDVRNLANTATTMNPTGLHTAKGMQFTPTEYQAKTNDSWLQLNKLAQWAAGYVKKEGEDISEKLRMQYGPELATLYKQNKVPASLSPETNIGLKNRAGWDFMNQTRTEFKERIRKGDFNKIPDMQKALHTVYSKGRQTVAESWGWDPEDKDFNDGLSKDWDKMGYELVNDMLAFTGTKTEAELSNQVRQQYLSVYKSQELMYNGLASKEISKNIQGLIDRGEVNAPLARTIIENSLQDATTVSGGVNFLASMKDTKVVMEGFSGTYEELIGPQQWQLLMAKAKSTQADNDAVFNENISVTLAGLQYKSVQEANEILKEAKNKVNYRYREESTNPFRDQIINAEVALQNRILSETAKANRDALAKQQLSIDTARVAERYQRVIAGENLSLNHEYVDGMNKEAWVASVNAMVESINNNNDMSEEEKAFRLSELLRVDEKDGPVTAILQTNVDRASSEIAAAIKMGAFPDDPKYLSGFNNIKALYNANPSLITQKYPEIADKLYLFDLADDLGLPKSVMLESMQIRGSLTKEQNLDNAMDWRTKQKDTHLGLSWLPKYLDDAARVVYEVTKASSNDTNAALRAASEFVSKSAWKYDAEDKTGKYKQDVYGAIPKNWLQTDNTLESYKMGSQIISDQIKQLKELSPNQRITMKYNPAGDYVELYASDGKGRRITKEELAMIAEADYGLNSKSLDVQAEMAKDRDAKAARIANSPAAAVFGMTVQKAADLLR